MKKARIVKTPTGEKTTNPIIAARIEPDLAAWAEQRAERDYGELPPRSRTAALLRKVLMDARRADEGGVPVVRGPQLGLPAVAPAPAPAPAKPAAAKRKRGGR